MTLDRAEQIARKADLRSRICPKSDLFYIWRTGTDPESGLKFILERTDESELIDRIETYLKSTSAGIAPPPVSGPLKPSQEPKAVSSLYRKLADLSTANLLIHKSQAMTIGGRTYKYADLPAVLAAVRPAMGARKLAIVQLIDGSDLITRLVDAESGESIESRFPLDFRGLTWHQIGSAISYARRYAICALLNISPDDDDDGVSTLPATNNRAAAAAVRAMEPKPAPDSIPPCPSCSRVGMKSKYGSGYYCSTCRAPYSLELEGAEYASDY